MTHAPSEVVDPKKSQTIEQTRVDQFEVFNELVRRNNGALLRELLPWTVALLGIAFAVMSHYRPLPVVILDDTEAVNPKLFTHPNAVPAAKRDAERFFVRFSQLLHTWTSTTVLNQMESAKFLMTAKQRQSFTNNLATKVAIPTSIVPSGQTTLLGSYVFSRVQSVSTVEWPKCKKTGPQWHCEAILTVVTAPLLTQKGSSRVYRVRSRFEEVQVTADTLDGFLVASWIVKEKL